MLGPGIVTNKPVPSLAQWLGDGQRAEGFEEWIQETISLGADGLPPNEASVLRLIQTLTIAFMEAMRAEVERHGRTPAEVVHLTARAAGVAIMSPVLSLCRDDAKSLHALVRLMADDFKTGAKQMTNSAIRGGHVSDRG